MVVPRQITGTTLKILLYSVILIFFDEYVRLFDDKIGIFIMRYDTNVVINFIAIRVYLDAILDTFNTYN